MRKQKIIGLLFLLSLGSPKSAVFKEEETEIEEFGGALVNKTPQGDEVVQARIKRSAIGTALKIISTTLAVSNTACKLGTVIHDVVLRDRQSSEISKRNICKLTEFIKIV